MSAYYTVSLLVTTLTSVKVLDNKTAVKTAYLKDVKYVRSFAKYGRKWTLFCNGQQLHIQTTVVWQPSAVSSYNDAS